MKVGDNLSVSSGVVSVPFISTFSVNVGSGYTYGSIMSAVYAGVALKAPIISLKLYDSTYSENISLDMDSLGWAGIIIFANTRGTTINGYVKVDGSITAYFGGVYSYSITSSGNYPMLVSRGATVVTHSNLSLTASSSTEALYVDLTSSFKGNTVYVSTCSCGVATCGNVSIETLECYSGVSTGISAERGITVVTYLYGNPATRYTKDAGVLFIGGALAT